MSKPLIIKTNQTEDGEVYLTLEQFRPLFGDAIDRAVYYDISPVGDGTLAIKLFDENMKIVLPSKPKDVQ